MTDASNLDSEVQNVVNVLDSEAIEYGDGSIGWVSIWPFDDEDPTMVSDPSVYRGQTGIGLFLAAHSHVKGSDEAEEMAQRVFRPWLETSPERIEVSQTGGLTGVGSLIYSLMECSVLLDEPDYLTKAATLAASIDDREIRDGNKTDVIKGNAGLLVVLTELLSAGIDRQEPVRRRARTVADTLLEESRQTGPGIGWSTQKDHPRTGFAHGAAGIAYSLFKAANELSEPRYRTIAERALEFEDHLYSHEKKNWANSPSRDRYQRTWCWGAEGILMSRYAIADSSGEDTLPENPRPILEELIDDTPQKHSLCHGSAGRAMALRYMSTRASYELPVGDAATTLLEQVREYRLENGHYAIPGLEDAPTSRLSLFRGIAGIGYACLYDRYPSQLPNPVLLQSSASSR